MICPNCLRPVATADDHARWSRETDEHLPDGYVIRFQPELAVPFPGLLAYGLDYNTRAPDIAPSWALKMCWPYPWEDGPECLYTRRWASDRHIDEAKRVFDEYVSTLSVSAAGTPPPPAHR